MKRLLYYLPSVLYGDDRDAAIDGSGVRLRFGDAMSIPVPVGHGPDGHRGIIVADRRPGVRYLPDSQEWKDCGAFWLGWDRDDRPGPRDLERDDIQPGVPVLLNDGNEWIVPTARLLPRVRKFVDGQWIQARDSKKDGLFDLAERAMGIWEAVCPLVREYLIAHRRAVEAVENNTPDATALSNAFIEAGEAIYERLSVDAPDITTAALAANYRIAAEEISALELISVNPEIGDSHDWKILDALVDGRGIRLVRKKNEKFFVPADWL